MRTISAAVLSCWAAGVAAQDSTPGLSTSVVQLPTYVAKELVWHWPLSGEVGARPRQPRRMHSHACTSNGETRLYVSWAAHNGYGPNVRYPEQDLWTESSIGHVAELGFDGAAAHLIRDIEFPYCNDMWGIAANADCSLVSALCRSSHSFDNFRTTAGLSVSEAVNVVEAMHEPFGWKTETSSDRPIDMLFLLEFQGGLGNKPTAAAMVSHSIGGWDYGHWHLVLDSQAQTYFVSIKVAVGGHEGHVWIAMQRNWNVVDHGYACGTGHTLGNHAVYNEAVDVFARICRTDGTYDRPANTPTHGTFFGTFTGSGQEPQLAGRGARPNAYWRGEGGPGGMISLGENGFLGVGIGPSQSQSGDDGRMTIGLIKLPTAQQDYDASVHTWKWLDLPETDLDSMCPAGVEDDDSLGFPMLQTLGSGGENSGRQLVGWAQEVAFRGVANKVGSFHIAEYDAEGCRLGDAWRLPAGAGWGQENVWAYLPQCGCVAMLLVQSARADGSYGNCGECAGDLTAEYFSDELRVTTYCPQPQSTCRHCDLLGPCSGGTSVTFGSCAGETGSEVTGSCGTGATDSRPGATPAPTPAPLTPAPAPTPANVYERVDGVGAWGGVCTCFDGQAYNVGDRNDGCRDGPASLACVGGVPGACERRVDSSRAGMQATCAGGVNTYEKVDGVGAWGGSCACPNGQRYNVGDYNDACRSLACVGGEAGPCERSLGESRRGMRATCGAANGPAPANSGSVFAAASEGHAQPRRHEFLANSFIQRVTAVTQTAVEPGSGIHDPRLEEL